MAAVLCHFGCIFHHGCYHTYVFICNPIIQMLLPADCLKLIILNGHQRHDQKVQESIKYDVIIHTFKYEALTKTDFLTTAIVLQVKKMHIVVSIFFYKRLLSYTVFYRPIETIKVSYFFFQSFIFCAWMFKRTEAGEGSGVVSSNVRAMFWGPSYVT